MKFVVDWGINILLIQIVSDLHLEFHKLKPAGYTGIEPAPGADVLVIAGDIALGKSAIAPFANWPVPVIYVAGNHEHYGSDISKVQKAIREAAEDTCVHYLERETVVINGVRFLGTTLWTDYLLFGRDKQAFAMFDAEEQLNDHSRIRLNGKRFRARDALFRHADSKRFLVDTLAEPFDGASVIVTHHGPHINSIHAKYRTGLLSAAFASDLTPMMGMAPTWIHGHVHDSFDFVVNGTRVIANPRGYPTANGFENEDFDPWLVVKV